MEALTYIILTFHVTITVSKALMIDQFSFLDCFESGCVGSVCVPLVTTRGHPAPTLVLCGDDSRPFC